MHKRRDARMGMSHNACGYTSMRLAILFGLCDALGIPNNVVFGDYFNRVLRA